MLPNTALALIQTHRYGAGQRKEGLMNVGAPFLAHNAAEAIEPGQRAHTKVRKIQPWGKSLGG
jgi:hypothetical protein